MAISKKLKVLTTPAYSRAMNGTRRLDCPRIASWCSHSLPFGIYANQSQIQREHKKAEAAGTRAPVKANGLPVKAPKETVTVRIYI